jgi:hypothetical protein
MTRSLHSRAALTEKVVARFRDKPFDWTKAATCIHLARAQVAAFGHRPPPVPKFRSALSAKKALKARGFDSLEAMLDTLLPRIPPAAMLVGDLALLPGEEGMDTLVIAAGGGMVLGWHGDDASRMRPIIVTGADIIAAWRV